MEICAAEVMRTFVMGDLHGAHAALLECLRRSGFDRANDRLIQLGDVVDGHEGVHSCVEELLTIRNLVAIRGNHDDWLNEFIVSGYHPALWNYGGVATAKSYLRARRKSERLLFTGKGYKTPLNPGDIPLRHKAFFSKQVLYYIDELNNCYVHAGFDPGRPLEGQAPEVYFWDRELWGTAVDQKEKVGMGTEFRTVFLGHSCTLQWGTDRPMQAGNIFNLDTGAGSSGRLTIMDVVSKEFWQSDPAR